MQNTTVKAGLGLAASAALAAGLCSAPAFLPAAALPSAAAAETGSGVVINEAYLSGGSANAVFKNKFVELYNPTDAPVSLDGWSLQYRSATGTGAPSGRVALAGTIPAKGYYLVGGATNNAGSPAPELPEPDQSTTLSPSGTTGTLFLSDQDAALDPGTGDVKNHPDVVDLLGYGTSNTFETAVAASPAGNSDPKSFNRTGFSDTDNNAGDFTLSGTVTPGLPNSLPAGPGTGPGPAPSAPARTIAEIQGTGDATGLSGQTVATRGVVTAVYPTGGFRGYYLQTPGTGGDTLPAASTGLFVFSDATVGQVQVGDHVEVAGTAGEYFGLTQLTVAAGNATVLAEPAEAVKPLTVEWPATDAERERLEGMLWDPQGEWTVADNYSLNNYGEIGLAAGGTPLLQPTDAARAGSAEAAAVAADNAARALTLDDGATTNFLSNSNGGANKDIALPYLAPEAPVRVGAEADFTGPVVVDYRNSAWKAQPRTHLTAENAASVQPAVFENDRTHAPEETGGNLTLASFNVLNYFTTTNDELGTCTSYDDRDGNPVGVRGGCDARGAFNAENLERQEAKIVAAINGLDADVVSLEEIENSAAFGKDRDAALATLVDALNETSAELWSYVPSPEALPADEDVIRTAFIYKRSAAKPIDESVILDAPAFDNARQPLAQTFMKVGGDNATKFVAIVNHFKSKGSGPAAGENADSGDGQGAWNADRVEQARALVAFAEEMKDYGNTEKVFLTGDFNSYTQEDPMQVLYQAGYINQGAKSGGQTYLFDGLVGSLDHILASPAADATVEGVDVWDINADEPIALEYSRHNYNLTDFYAADPFRASDHDPVLVGVQLDKQNQNR